MLEKVVVGVDVDLVKDVVTQYTCDCKVVKQFHGSYTAALAYDVKTLMTSLSTKNKEGRRFIFPWMKLLLVFIQRLVGNSFFSLLPEVQMFLRGKTLLSLEWAWYLQV